ncbi:hypothetical protein DTW90_18490 [Neorhizobium sp. P12A]|uniref:hypothetical protein n=1 Tax=Neorhizobium sp. P12A TaxID=2268027 RepID=UPI0011F037CC|nr:hypothetical protein [Neorhizobium sp. P12A]KAA0697420.1 hypothetical protein DTW90_18490 [Neorhizobium sp. P12A]
MVKVKYIPEAGTPDETETLNHKFNAKRPTEVTDPSVIAVLRGNPFFEVLDKEPAPVPAPKAPAPKQNEPLTASEQPDGTFAVLQGDAIVKAGLSKEDADAFNALSDEDKAEYVK